MLEYLVMQKISAVVDTVKKPLMNKFGVSGDNDEVTVGGKGIRWGIFALVAIIVVGGIAAFYTFYSDANTKVQTNLNQLRNLFNGR